LLSKPYD